MIYKSETVRSTVSSHMTKMFMKVGLSIIATFLISCSLALYVPKVAVIFLSWPMILLIGIGEVVLIILMSKKVQSLNISNINLLFSLFVILNGFGFTYIYFFFSLTEILYAAGAAGLFFLSMGTYGYVTKKDLSSWGSVLNVALISIVGISILHSILSLFTGHRSSLIEILVSMATIVVVSLHTAYEMNRYQNFFLSNINSKMKDGLVTLGAVSLYLNYIIIFKHLLRLLRYTNRDNR